MAQLLDALEFKADNFLVAPREEWRIMNVGKAKRSATQPRFCAANCEDYLADKDKKCGRFFECTELIFDMHNIEKEESVVLVMFATEINPPYDGLSWWVSEKQLVITMGTKLNGQVDSDLGRRIVDAMIKEYTALAHPPKEGIVIV